MEITIVGFGSWAIGGGGWSFGWGPQDDAESLAAMHRAIEQGINWIDTAAAYRLGHSEELVGKLLRELSPHERRFVFTKCGPVAIAWVLGWPGATAAIVGARGPKQVDGWIGAASIALTEQDLDEIASAIQRTGAGAGPARPAVRPQSISGQPAMQRRRESSTTK